MNILFTTSAAPTKSPFSTDEKRPPLGLGSLIAVVREEGHKVFFIDNYLEPSRFIEEDYLQKNKIDLVGIYANTICHRDTLNMFNKIENLLKQIQSNLFQKALSFREDNTFIMDTWDEFKERIEKGGFILAHWDGTAETEQKIKDETKATIRTIPIENLHEEGECIYTGKPSKQRVVFARAY